MLSQSVNLSLVSPPTGAQAAEIVLIMITLTTIRMILLGGKMLRCVIEMFLLSGVMLHRGVEIDLIGAMTILLSAVMGICDVMMILLVGVMVHPAIGTTLPETRGIYLRKTEWIGHGLIAKKLSVIDRVAWVPRA